jgi:organic radical activating enzyme
LGGESQLRDLSDFRGDELVNGIIGLVERHDPIQVSLVGGEPLVRHRELSRVLPVLSGRGTDTMIVTSAVIPIPHEWMKLPRVTVAVSVDGLAPDHNIRRRPATYDRILKNIAGRRVNIHCTIVRQHMLQQGYLEQFLAFWSARPEVNRIWFSVYTPQRNESSAEMLLPEDRRRLAGLLPDMSRRFPKLMLPGAMAQAFVDPPKSPAECLFAKMSVNYTADLKTNVEPCVFGGNPDCSQCGCSISAGLHWIGGISVAGPLKVRHLVRASVTTGAALNRVFPHKTQIPRWNHSPEPTETLVQIETAPENDFADTFKKS